MAAVPQTSRMKRNMLYVGDEVILTAVAEKAHTEKCYNAKHDRNVTILSCMLSSIQHRPNITRIATHEKEDIED